jgi:hypothetical protein
MCKAKTKGNAKRTITQEIKNIATKGIQKLSLSVVYLIDDNTMS